MAEKKQNVLTLTTDELKDIVASALSALNESRGVQTQPLNPVVEKSLEFQINQRIREGEIFNNFLSKDKERKRLVINKIYVPYTGRSVTSSINGSTVKVPVDGNPYLVHPAHYSAIMEYIKYIDDQIERNSGNEDLLGIDSGDVQKI